MLHEEPWFWPFLSLLITAIAAPIAVQVFSHCINAKQDERQKKVIEEQERIRLENERAAQERARHDRIMGEAMQAVLRNNIVAVHNRYIPMGLMPIHEKSALEHTYKSYHELGGDDVATTLYKQLMELPDEETAPDDADGCDSCPMNQQGKRRQA